MGRYTTLRQSTSTSSVSAVNEPGVPQPCPDCGVGRVVTLQAAFGIVTERTVATCSRERGWSC